MPIAPVRSAPIVSHRRVPYLQFDGNGWVTIPPGFLPTSAITVTVWMRVKAIRPGVYHKAILARAYPSMGIHVSNSWAGRDSWGAGLTWDNGQVTRGYATQGALHQWTFMTIGWDGTNVYGGANGAWNAFGVGGNSPDWAGYGLTLAANMNHVEAFIGVLHDVRVYNRALSAQEIQSVYQGNPPRDGLVGEWLLNEGSGTVAYDTSGNGHHGTITGGVWVTDENTRATPLTPIRSLAPVR